MRALRSLSVLATSGITSANVFTLAPSSKPVRAPSRPFFRVSTSVLLPRVGSL